MMDGRHWVTKATLSPTTQHEHTHTTNGIAVEFLAMIACPACHLDTSVSHIAFFVTTSAGRPYAERPTCDRELLGSLRLTVI